MPIEAWQLSRFLGLGVTCELSLALAKLPRFLPLGALVFLNSHKPTLLNYNLAGEAASISLWLLQILLPEQNEIVIYFMK